MNVIIVGAGEVGESIARDLMSDHHVTIIELDPDRAQELTYSLDVLTINGDGTDHGILKDAGVTDADMLLATTDDDEVNIATCGTAKALSSIFTIARVKNTKYLRTWEQADRVFGIDFLVCTNLLVAQSIVRVVGLPNARDVEIFADGKIQMAEFEIVSDSPIVNETIETADRFESLTFAAIFRNGDVIIPRGDTRINPDDRVVVIGSPQSIQKFSRTLAPEQSPSENEEVVILGGSEVGYHIARLLEAQGLTPRLIENDAERARELAENLPGTLVMESDPADIQFLQSEHIGEADIVVSCLGNDEKNLLEGLLAKRLGAERTVVIIENTAYVELFETVGIDVGMSPRSVVAEEISQFTKAGKTENIAFIEEDKAEVIEVEITDESVLADRSIRDSIADLPAGVVIGAISRADELVVPRGDTIIATGDHVVLFADTEIIDAVTEKV